LRNLTQFESRWTAVFFWFLLGLLFAGVSQYRYAFHYGTDWSRLLHVDPDTPIGQTIVTDFGDDSISTSNAHDGMSSYLIARDPFGRAGLLQSWRTSEPDGGAGYRYRRILYSFLAGGGGSFSPRATLWGLIVLASIGFGMATAALFWIIRYCQLPIWVILGVFTNPGLIVSVSILSADSLAFGLSGIGICLYLASRHRQAALCFAGALLCKDQYWLIPVGIALYEFSRGSGRRGVLMFVLPVLPLVVWCGWLYLGLGLSDSFSPHGNFTLPLKGILSFMPLLLEPEALDRGTPAAMICTLLLGFLLVSRRISGPYRFLLAPWLLLACVLSTWVWRPTSDAARTLAPIWTLVFVGVAIVSSRRPKLPESHQGRHITGCFT
jgi:hypothetical protein